MKKIVYPAPSEWEALFQRAGQDYKNVHEVVAPILADVKSRGDEALREYGQKFDQVIIENFAVSEAEIQAAIQQVPQELKEAIQLAKQNIEQFHASQQESEKEVETMPGVVCWRRSLAIEKVGLYIPGQKAPLFSTLLMLGVPALMAGCQEIVICTPPRADASIHPVVLYTAHLLGIPKIF
ncbi:MAG: histidinol dehydrogenase, partial [Bacteroidota bacterium]